MIRHQARNTTAKTGRAGIIRMYIYMAIWLGLQNDKLELLMRDVSDICICLPLSKKNINGWIGHTCIMQLPSYDGDTDASRYITSFVWVSLFFFFFVKFISSDRDMHTPFVLLQSTKQHTWATLLDIHFKVCILQTQLTQFSKTVIRLSEMANQSCSTVSIKEHHRPHMQNNLRYLRMCGKSVVYLCRKFLARFRKLAGLECRDCPVRSRANHPALTFGDISCKEKSRLLRCMARGFRILRMVLG